MEPRPTSTASSSGPRSEDLPFPPASAIGRGRHQQGPHPDDAGTVVGILGTFPDITPRMDAVQQLRERLGETRAGDPPLS